MAYDKVVDSAVLDAGLKAIADAIREKGGTSDNLAFPTAMAEAIAAIESGGMVAVSSEVTFAADTKLTEYTYTHNLGVIPNIAAVVYISGAAASTTYILGGHVQIRDSSGFWYSCTMGMATSSSGYMSPSGGAVDGGRTGAASENTLKFTSPSSALKMYAGYKYIICCG